MSVGDYVSDDILVYSTPDLIANMSLFITHEPYHYYYACVFADNNSDFTYIHLLKSQTGYEAAEEKENFEAYEESHCVDIKYYHADNVILRGAL